MVEPEMALAHAPSNMDSGGEGSTLLQHTDISGPLQYIAMAKQLRNTHIKATGLTEENDSNYLMQEVEDDAGFSCTTIQHPQWG